MCTPLAFQQKPHLVCTITAIRAVAPAAEEVVVTPNLPRGQYGILRFHRVIMSNEMSNLDGILVMQNYLT